MESRIQDCPGFPYMGRDNGKKMYHCIFFIVSFEKSSQKLVLWVSSGGSKHRKTIKALRIRFRFCFLVFGTPDETVALVYDILRQKPLYNVVGLS